MWPALLYAILLWWAGTGVILLLNHRPRREHPALFAAATVLLGVALCGVAVTANDTRASGAFLAFTAAIVVWGWQELGFLLGYITGPRRLPCPPEARGWRRAGHAFMTILWHELVLLLLAAALWALTTGHPNLVALHSFGLLWLMRLSAKLNVFLGVRNLSADFLPPHLRYLYSYFRERPGNALFLPLLLPAVLGAVLLWLEALEAHSGFVRHGSALLATLLTLGVLEHLLMVLPLDSSRLWTAWRLRSRRS